MQKSQSMLGGARFRGFVPVTSAKEISYLLSIGLLQKASSVFTNHIKGYFYFKLVCLRDYGQQTVPYHWVLGGISLCIVSTTSILFSFTFLKPQQGFVLFHGPVSYSNWTGAAPCHFPVSLGMCKHCVLMTLFICISIDNNGTYHAKCFAGIVTFHLNAKKRVLLSPLYRRGTEFLPYSRSHCS